jgi:predicted nucleic acid-binding protein
MISRKVFIAPDVLVAFIDRAHPKHVHAAAFFRYFAQEHYQLYTSTEAVNETFNALYQKISPSLARDFLRSLSLGNINIIFPEESDLKTVFKTMLNYSSSELTMAEALMAVLASKRAIPQICTFAYLHSLFGLITFYLPI